MSLLFFVILHLEPLHVQNVGFVELGILVSLFPRPSVDQDLVWVYLDSSLSIVIKLVLASAYVRLVLPIYVLELNVAELELLYIGLAALVKR